jgi:class 3 adenylate cyclase
VNQYQGDGLVATFGATRAHEDDPGGGVLAALAMQDAFGGHTPDAGCPVVLRLRVGVNTGRAILRAACAGVDTRRPTMIGGALAFTEWVQTVVECGRSIRGSKRLVSAHQRQEDAVRGCLQP